MINNCGWNVFRLHSGMLPEKFCLAAASGPPSGGGLLFTKELFPMTINEKIAVLRGEMAKANVDALVIPTSDPHMSEYIPEAWKARKEFSGFTGSAGTLVITKEESGLWTDGRYFIQAENQLSGYYGGLWRPGIRGFAPYSYREVKSDRSVWYIDVLAEEDTRITESLIVTQSGRFSCQVAGTECLYAPHYRANDGARPKLETDK